MLTLTILNGQDKGREYQLTGEQAELLGRQAPTIKLSDAQTSRRHAEIILENNTWLIRDLGSTNGTWVNGQKITQLTELERGDRIVVGRHQLRVAKIADLPAPKPQPKPPQAEPVVGNEDLAAMGVDLTESLSADILDDQDLELPDLLDGLDTGSGAEQSLKEIDAQAPEQPEQAPAVDTIPQGQEAAESAPAEQTVQPDQKHHEQAESDEAGIIDLDALLGESKDEPLALPDLPDAPPADEAAPHVADQPAAEDETASSPSTTADTGQPQANASEEAGIIDLDALLGLDNDQDHDPLPPETSDDSAEAAPQESMPAPDAPTAQGQPLTVNDVAATPDAPEAKRVTEADHEYDPPPAVEDADAQAQVNPLEEPDVSSPPDEISQDQPGEPDSLIDIDILGSAQPTSIWHTQEDEPPTDPQQPPAPQEQTPDEVVKDQTPPSPKQADETGPASADILPQDADDAQDGGQDDDQDILDLDLPGLDTFGADRDMLTALTGDDPEPSSDTPDPQDDVSEDSTKDESQSPDQPPATVMDTEAVTTDQTPADQAQDQEQDQEQAESTAEAMDAEVGHDSAPPQEDLPDEADEQDQASQPMVTADAGAAGDDLGEADLDLLLSPDEQAQALAGYKRSRWKTLVMMILAVAVLGAGGWYVVNGFGNSSDANSKTPKTILPNPKAPGHEPQHDAVIDDRPDPLVNRRLTPAELSLTQKPLVHAQTTSPTPPDTHTPSPLNPDEADPFADVPSYVTAPNPSAGASASAGVVDHLEPVDHPASKEITQANPLKTAPTEPGQIDLLSRTVPNSATTPDDFGEQEALERLIAATDAQHRPDTHIMDPAVFADARKVAFIIDASGSLVDSFPFVLARLGADIAELPDDTAFAVIFFGHDGEVEPPPAGLRWADRRTKRYIRQWVSPENGNITAWGRGDPVKALELALSYHVDEVRILSDNLLGSRILADDAKQAVDHITKLLDGRVRKVDIIQFYDRDPHGILAQIASQLPGSYEQIDP